MYSPNKKTTRCCFLAVASQASKTSFRCCVDICIPAKKIHRPRESRTTEEDWDQIKRLNRYTLDIVAIITKETDGPSNFTSHISPTNELTT